MDDNSEFSDNNGQHLHSNWRALASVHFKPKIFIKSSGTENHQIVKSNKIKHQIVNVQSSEFYQEVLNMPSTSTANDIKVEKQKSYHSLKRKEKTQKVPFCKAKFFRLALNNDPEAIAELIKTSSNVDINAVDNFGWTALMISACEGSTDSFRSLLIDHNASLDFKDRTGNTALSLAQKNNHSDILNIIEEYNSQNNYTISSDEEVEEQEGTQFCPDCKIEIKKSSSRSHQSSTVHLFSCKYNTNATIKSFGIANSNKGFKLMKTIGWDGSSALGARQNGKMYPVKTVIRKGRTGLGTKQDDPKITHFKANDVRAVHYKSQPPALTRKEILKQSLREKRHEQMLRRELS